MSAPRLRDVKPYVGKHRRDDFDQAWPRPLFWTFMALVFAGLVVLGALGFSVAPDVEATASNHLTAYTSSCAADGWVYRATAMELVR